MENGEIGKTPAVGKFLWLFEKNGRVNFIWNIFRKFLKQFDENFCYEVKALKASKKS